MRDAFGGAFMIQIFLVFVLIYICFTAMALNYAKAFKVKNTIIEYLENSEITDLKNLTTANERDAMKNFINTEVLGNYNYNIGASNICNTAGEDTLLTTGENKVYGYCHNSGIIIRQSDKAENTEGVYYTVSTYVGWSIPFLNSLLSLNGNNKQQEVPVGLWEISGQTRLIVNG